MLIKDGGLLYELSEYRFYKWLKSRLNGSLDELEDAGAKIVGKVGLDITHIRTEQARKLVKDYESK